jgi:O-antigen/teichoic acid export membrane protein
MVSALWSRLKQPAAWYIGVSLLVSFVGFVRAFLFMHTLGLAELGVLVVAQTIGQGVGLLQGGLLSGGYRMFAAVDRAEREKLNNLLFSFFAVLLALLALLWALLAASGAALLPPALLLASIALGMATLVATWMTNTLLGSQRTGELNRINLIAVVGAVALLPVAYYGGLWGALLALLAQPLVLVAVCLLRQRDLRPTGWLFDRASLRRVFGFGFIPFLATMFVLLNYQIERWAIGSLLGAAELGQFYLVFLYASLFALVPGAILSIFFPRAIRAYQDGAMDEVRAILRNHVLLVLAYLAAVVALTLLALRPVVALVFPAHAGNVDYVLLFLPGLVALVLCDPLALLLNAALRLRVMFWAGLGSVLLLCGLIGAAAGAGMFALGAMALIKSIVNVAVLLLYAAYVWRHWRRMLAPR